MHDEKYYSLYTVEANVGECKTGLAGQDYHSFLVLIEETPGQEPRIDQELHFMMNREGISNSNERYLTANSKQSGRSFGDLHFRGYVGGKADVMDAVWTDALEIASEIRSLRIPFTHSSDEASINCRSGTKAVIETLGLDYIPVLEDVTTGNITLGNNSDIASKLKYKPAIPL